MLLTVIIALGLVGIDQLVKLLAVRTLAPDGACTFIQGFIEFRYVENDGAAFSLLSGKQGILIAITSIALLAVGFVLLFRRPKNRLEYLALLMIFSGGVGNLIDRIANGYVVDYINFLFVRFAVFNLADCLVCLGFALLLVAVIRSEAREKKKARESVRQDHGAE